MIFREREWQTKAREKCLKWFLEKSTNQNFINKNKFLVNAAPASGKTKFSCSIARILFDQNEIERVIVIAPTDHVVKQWAKDFYDFTNKPMTRMTGQNCALENYGFDICASWQSVKNLSGAFQKICQKNKCLVICDEQHHAAVEAAWGLGAASAFSEAKFVLILSGTPIRSDKEDALWISVDNYGNIQHPTEGSYTITYGEAVDRGYCRPVTFSREEGKFRYELEGETVAEISSEGVKNRNIYKKNKLTTNLDIFKCAKIRVYLKNGLPDPRSYQSKMIFSASDQLTRCRNVMPDAGALVIAPDIETAKYMAKVIEVYLKEKPVLVHSKDKSSSSLIESYKKTDRKWLVSVNMVSEGVDIDRLRVLVFLPFAETELFFRQAMGRVVRSRGPDDDSFAYVVMPFHKIFEQYALRVRNEMSMEYRNGPKDRKFKRCPVCLDENKGDAKNCVNENCGYEFPITTIKHEPCDNCGHLNSVRNKECLDCGKKLEADFIIKLEDQYRDGGISNGIDIDENTMKAAEENDEIIRDYLREKGSAAYFKWYKTTTPEERIWLLNQLNKFNKKN